MGRWAEAAVDVAEAWGWGEERYWFQRRGRGRGRGRRRGGRDDVNRPAEEVVDVVRDDERVVFPGESYELFSSAEGHRLARRVGAGGHYIDDMSIRLSVAAKVFVDL